MFFFFFNSPYWLRWPFCAAISPHSEPGKKIGNVTQRRMWRVARIYEMYYVSTRTMGWISQISFLLWLLRADCIVHFIQLRCCSAYRNKTPHKPIIKQHEKIHTHKPLVTNYFRERCAHEHHMAASGKQKHRQHPAAANLKSVTVNVLNNNLWSQILIYGWWKMCWCTMFSACAAV